MTQRILTALALALAACGGDAKPKGDCAKAIDTAMSLSKEDYQRSNVAETTLPEIRKTSLARCTEDKWSSAVLVCLEGAKSTQDVIKCQQQMTKEQQNALGKAVTAVMMAAADQPTAAATPDAGAATALPADCDQYRQLIEKLATCDKLPESTRTMLEQSFTTTAKTWEGFDKLPEDQKTALAAACKQGVETVNQTARTACGW